MLEDILKALSNENPFDKSKTCLFLTIPFIKKTFLKTAILNTLSELHNYCETAVITIEVVEEEGPITAPAKIGTLKMFQTWTRFL